MPQRKYCLSPFILVLLVLFLFSANCKGNTSEGMGTDALGNPETPSSGETDMYTIKDAKGNEILDAFILNGLDFPFGTTIHEIEENMGKPVKVITKEIINRHDPTQTDILYDLYYEGLHARIYKVVAYKKDIIILVSVSDKNYKIKHGLTIGSPEQEILEVLGRPDEKIGNVLYYNGSDFVMASVQFVITDKKISEITWIYNVN